MSIWNYRASPTPFRDGLSNAVNVAAAALAMALFAMVFALFSPVRVLTVVSGCVGVLVFLLRRQWVIYATVISLVMTLPAGMSLNARVGGITVSAFEIFLAFSTVYAFAALPRNRRAESRIAVFLAVLLLWSAFGLAKGHSLFVVISESRAPIYALMAYFVASRVGGTELARGVLRLLPIVLGVSAFVTLLASIFGMALAGRSVVEDSGGMRLISSATQPSLAVFCGVVALLIMRRTSVRHSAVYWIPAILILFLSFSRNTILGVVAAVVFSMIALGLARAISTAVRVVCFGLLIAAGVALLYPLIRTLPGGGWLSLQFETYSDRVISGLSDSGVQVDGSIQYRTVHENPYLLRAISESPVYGHGFGYAYKPLYTGRTFTFAGAQSFQYYAHNFYLWIWVKAGVLGLVGFLYAFASPLLFALRSKESAQLAAGGAAAALLACSVVAPMPANNATATLLGAAIGICIGRYRRPDAASESEVSLNEDAVQVQNGTVGADVPGARRPSEG